MGQCEDTGRSPQSARELDLAPPPSRSDDFPPSRLAPWFLQISEKSSWDLQFLAACCTRSCKQFLDQLQKRHEAEPGDSCFNGLSTTANVDECVVSVALWLMTQKLCEPLRTAELLHPRVWWPRSLPGRWWDAPWLPGNPLSFQFLIKRKCQLIMYPKYFNPLHVQLPVAQLSHPPRYVSFPGDSLPPEFIWCCSLEPQQTLLP